LEDVDPVAAAVSVPLRMPEEEPVKDRLYWMTTPLVLLLEDADPVAVAVSSPVVMPKKSLKKHCL
jgi:hypothetical protein